MSDKINFTIDDAKPTDHKSSIAVYNKIKEMIGDGEINISNIIEIVPELMKVVESYKELRGPQKKQIIIDIILQVIDETMPSDLDILKTFISLSLPIMMDTFINLDKSKMVIKLKKCFLNCC